MRLFEMVQQLDEVKMSPSRLNSMASGIKAQGGMEFEMIVPVETSGGDELYLSSNDSVTDLDSVGEFFSNGGTGNSRVLISSLITAMEEDHLAWRDQQLAAIFDDDPEAHIIEFLIDEWDSSPDQIDRLIARYQVQDGDPKIGKLVRAARRYFAETADDGEHEVGMSDWLARKFPTMLDVYESYEDYVEWPYRASSVDITSIHGVAQDFGDAIGRGYVAYERHNGGPRPPGKYVVEPDTSLTDGPGILGLEFVSPVLPIDQLISDLHKVKAWAGMYGCYTDNSCGLHINLSLAGRDMRDLDYVKLALFVGDRQVLSDFGRMTNVMCRSALAKIGDDVGRLEIAQLGQIQSDLRSGMIKAASKAIHSGETSKYVSLNVKTKDGKPSHLEFRSPGGDWLDDNFELIVPTLNRFVVALDIAMDPDKHRREYMTKLVKLISDNTPTTDIAVPFARFAAGEINKVQLSMAVKYIRLRQGRTA